MSGIPSAIRRRLENAPGLTQTLQAGRAVVHFGPWRHLARAAIRQARPPRSGEGLSTSVSLGLNTTAIVDGLNAQGMAVAGQLPPDILQQIRAVTDDLPMGEYGDFHDHPDVAAIVTGPDVLDVVRAYMGAEPELLECTLVVHHAEDPGRPVHDQRRFHFDFAGWQSLNLFVYLTDVSEDAGAHQVVLGTHRGLALRDAARGWVPDDEIFARYGDRVHTITGPAGTMFFENTEAFHRRLVMKRRRVMLNVLYASHRSWLSHGRLTPKYVDYVRRRTEQQQPA